MEDKFGLVFFPKAAEDIESILDYIAVSLKNPIAAQNLIEKMYKKIDNIRYFPNSMPKISNPAVVQKNMRKLAVENYIVFYSVNEITRTVEVIRVLYGMMNWIDLL